MNNDMIDYLLSSNQYNLSKSSKDFLKTFTRRSIYFVLYMTLLSVIIFIGFLFYANNPYKDVLTNLEFVLPLVLITACLFNYIYMRIKLNKVLLEILDKHSEQGN